MEISETPKIFLEIITSIFFGIKLTFQNNLMIFQNFKNDIKLNL